MGRSTVVQARNLLDLRYRRYRTTVGPSKSITCRPDIARVVILLDLVLLVFSVVVFYRF